jgi:hypothetical protein
MHVHPVLPRSPKLQQPQLPRSEPDGQPNESSQLGKPKAGETVVVAGLDPAIRARVPLTVRAVAFSISSARHGPAEEAGC